MTTGAITKKNREGQYLGHATLLVPDGLSFKVLVEVRAVMRVEMLMLDKVDFDWLLTFYPPPMERLRDELTDWVQVLQWISLPKVYAKKIRRIVQNEALTEGKAGLDRRSPSRAGIAPGGFRASYAPLPTSTGAAAAAVATQASGNAMQAAAKATTSETRTAKAMEKANTKQAQPLTPPLESDRKPGDEGGGGCGHSRPGGEGEREERRVAVREGDTCQGGNSVEGGSSSAVVVANELNSCGRARGDGSEVGDTSPEFASSLCSSRPGRSRDRKT